MDTVLIILFMIILLLMKGFFSGTEIALVNSDKLKLHHRANQGHKGAKLVLKLFETPDALLGTTLVGTNISTIALTTIAAVLMIRSFGSLGDLYAVLIFSPLFLILGEIVPKSIYQQKSDVIAPIVVYPLRMFSWLFYPIVFVFSRVARLAARLAGGGKTEQNLFITREQMRMLVEMAERGSNVDVFDRSRIKRVIRFAETTVGEAMIPIAEVAAINRDKSTQEAIRLVRRKGYNRLPVYEQNISNIVGVITLTTWDLMVRELAEKPLGDLIKPACYCASLQTIDELLPILQKREDHMAIVVDEFGSATGIITMEDILEEVVGEINVGYDFGQYIQNRRRRDFEKIAEDVYTMDSRLPISEVNEILHIDLPGRGSHTIGGFVMARLRRIPKEGDSLVESGYRFTVSKATERAIIKLKVELI
uniref:Hemolysin, contains CBS domains n=1 Tax=Candidatus Kentrum sp. LFY TaxID=2126342 RepID=A0A450U4S4_9GAMM|nr:MAG: Hemolysin, contains CBS domains [Candidatus Kentron sp. LFY]VFJ97909.1 MAG: Hemolysin, contains CBS domains [Candidatus Kentron sp. LFY]VFK18356.1 MAG: Hemolysin, contains CBS domains [Candidatus Kentron sp. LFY]